MPNEAKHEPYTLLGEKNHATRDLWIDLSHSKSSGEKQWEEVWEVIHIFGISAWVGLSFFSGTNFSEFYVNTYENRDKNIMWDLFT